MIFFLQTSEVNADLLFNGSMDRKCISDLSSHIQYKCKNVNIPDLRAPVTVRSLNPPLSDITEKLLLYVVVSIEILREADLRVRDGLKCDNNL